MDQKRVDCGTCLSQGIHCIGIDHEGPLGLIFSTIYGGIGGGIDDDTWALFPQVRVQGAEIAQIQFRPRGGYHIQIRSKGFVQRTPDLPGPAQQKHLHASYCFFTQSRYAPLVTSRIHSPLSRYQRSVLRRPLSHVSDARQPNSPCTFDASIA